MLDQANDLRELVRQCAVPQARPAGPSPRRIVLCGGKEGVGTTTLGVNLAVLLAQSGTRTVLVDTAQGSRHTPCAVRPPLLQFGGRHSESACYYGADAVVFDVGNPPDRLARRLWQAADERLFITTADTAAIIDAYATIKLLSEPAHAEPIWLLVNAAESAESGVEAHRRLERACRRFLGITLTDGGCVPLDPEVPKAAWASKPFVLAAPSCSASRSLDRLANLVNSQRLAKPQAAALHTS